MIRPKAFGFNPETAENNAFQQDDEQLSAKKAQQLAKAEFDQLQKVLEKNGIMVTVVEDAINPSTPDAIFPNNWISLHANGALITYPMFSKLRRQERREDVIEKLMKKVGYSRRYSLEQYEEKGLFLEGTGSMVLDRTHRIVFACLSARTDPTILDKFCALMGYQRLVFSATDRDGQLIYHTNVMMALGHDFAVVCLESIASETERAELIATLNRCGKEIVEISFSQMEAFAGNMLLLRNREMQPILVMSEQARKSLDDDQLNALSARATVVSSPIPTIERLGGGSVRCMLAELIDPSIIN